LFGGFDWDLIWEKIVRGDGALLQFEYKESETGARHGGSKRYKLSQAQLAI
jgi:hypothetical protein